MCYSFTINTYCSSFFCVYSSAAPVTCMYSIHDLLLIHYSGVGLRMCTGHSCEYCCNAVNFATRRNTVVSSSRNRRNVGSLHPGFTTYLNSFTVLFLVELLLEEGCGISLLINVLSSSDLPFFFHKFIEFLNWFSVSEWSIQEHAGYVSEIPV